jgi:hypothetical protein
VISRALAPTDALRLHVHQLTGGDQLISARVLSLVPTEHGRELCTGEPERKPKAQQTPRE